MLDEKLSAPSISRPSFGDNDDSSSSSHYYSQIQDSSASSAVSNNSFEIIDLGDPSPMSGSSSDMVFPILRPDLGNWIRSIDDYENGEVVRRETRRRRAEARDEAKSNKELLEMIPRPKWSNRRVTFGKEKINYNET